MIGIRVFQLLEALEAGKSARARLLDWNGEMYRPRTLAEVRVHDFVGEHGQPGDRGYCFMSDESHRWEVLSGLANKKMTPARDDRANKAGDGNPRPSRRAPLFPASGHGVQGEWPFSSPT
jgi:hypothetical protein